MDKNLLDCIYILTFWGERMEKTKKIRLPARASLFYGISIVLSKAIGALTTPIFTRAMSTEEYGIYSYYISILGIGSMICTAFLTPSVFYSGLRKFQGEEENFSVLAVGLTNSINLLFCLALFTFSGVFGIDRSLVLIMVFQIFFDSVVSTRLLKLKFSYGYGEVTLINLASAAISSALSLILVLGFDLGAYGRAFGILISGGIISALIILGDSRKAKKATLQGRISERDKPEEYAYKNKVPDFFRPFLDKNKRDFLIRNALPMIPAVVARASVGWSDKLMIRAMMGTESLAKYSVAHTVGLALFALIGALSSAMNPWIIRKLSAGKKDATYPAISAISALIGWGAVIAIAVAPEILAFLAPKSYSDAIFAIAPFAMSSAPYFIYSTVTVYLGFAEKTKLITLSAISGAAINILSNFLLIPRLGYLGGAMSYFICEGAMCVLSLRLLSKVDLLTASSLKNGINMPLQIILSFIFVLLYPYPAMRIFLLIIPAIFATKNGFFALELAKEK